MKKMIKYIVTALICLSINPVGGTVLAGAADQPAAASSRAPYVLAIGISRYKYMPELKSPLLNAEAFGAFFSGKAQDVAVLTDSRATKRAITAKLYSYQALLTTEDHLIIYYSGHGGYNQVYWQSYDADRTLARGRSEYMYEETLIPYDAGYDKASHVTTSELSMILKKLPATVTVIIDPSYSKNRGYQTIHTFSERSRAKRPYRAFRDLSMYGFTVIVSSDYAETAYDDSFKGLTLGIFTQYFIEGLAGPADTNQDHSIHLTEAFEYGSLRTIQHIGVQHPRIYKGKKPNIQVIKLD
ncbi:caspase family protein [Acetonema longum]|uniref:Peptidase C14 caspase domain-containing protein n=1 Tax=Acetonema longum DSM 6540 TaxID=1009370 RepID=F7NII0_9FIRM|nr:caspase family protein [Acetonema longum]EGO64126.1 hypothetical protein ALO_09414 [Acetonema longum DSM 6540]